MRILWSSNAPFCTTGYAVQTRLFTPRIRDLGHDVAIAAFYGLEGGQLNLNGIPILPRSFHPYGQDVLAAHAAYWRADIVISHMDLWVTEPIVATRTRHVPYFPVDSEPLPEIIRSKAEMAFERVVFSHFACEQMDAIGLAYQYVPHAVDTHALRPMDQREARDAIGLPADAFIVGMVAANKGNPSRKALWQQIAAFDELHKRHSDAVLYLHMTSGKHGENGGVNLPEFIEKATNLRLGRDVLFADQYQLIAGYNDEYMRAAYSSFDVLTLVSHGEGFGIPLIEAQSCGTPVVTGSWTAMEELCFAGWLVPKEDATPVWTPLATWQFEASVPAITEAMEQAYGAKDNRKLRAKARKHALEYDADLVTRKFWAPALESIAARIRDESPALEQAAG